MQLIKTLFILTLLLNQTTMFAMEKHKYSGNNLVNVLSMREIGMQCPNVNKAMKELWFARYKKGLKKQFVEWNKPQELIGHRGEVNSVAIWENKIVSGSSDETVRVWENGQCLQELIGHEGDVLSVAIWDNKIVSGSSNETVRVWENGQCLQELKGHRGEVNSVAIWDNKIVSGSSDETVRVWENGLCLQVLHGHERGVISVAGWGNKIVSGSHDKTVRVWDENGQCLQVLKGHKDTVNSAAGLGNKIVSGSRDKTVRVWDAELLTDNVSLSRLKQAQHEMLAAGIDCDDCERKNSTPEYMAAQLRLIGIYGQDSN